MELIWRYLCVIICLQSVSCGEDDDTVLSMLNHISISLARIARKQRLMDKRIDSLAANMKNNELIEGKQENVVPVAESGEDAKEDIIIMRRAIASEKEYVRNLVESLSADIGGRIAAVEATSDDLGDKIAAVKETSDDLGDKIAAVEATSDDVRIRVDTIETSISTLESAAGRHASFSVRYKPDGKSAVLKKGTTIKFNQVIYNDGSGYDETTGIFTVPVSGVYQIIFFVEGWSKNDDFSCTTALVGLYVDGAFQTSALADPQHKEQNIQSGNAYINYLSKGQKVKVDTLSAYCDEYSIFAYRTTFSGALLYKY